MLRSTALALWLNSSAVWLLVLIPGSIVIGITPEKHRKPVATGLHYGGAQTASVAISSSSEYGIWIRMAAAPISATMLRCQSRSAG
jgi:hypothetical protein